jgi:hypothetical protein
MNNPFETYSRGMTARERRIRSRWALMFVISSLVAIWLMVKVGNQENEIDELTRKNSELHGENFANEVELTRWETTIDWYKEENPAEARKIEEWRSHNTE